ncbi:MAG: hypothetical protein AB1458_09840 [Bacteroidota bacterium]
MTLVCSPAQAQLLEDGTMKFWGNIKAEPTKKPLGGVTVALYKGYLKVKETVTDKSGKFSIEVGTNSGEYKMIFTCPAYLTMYCTINTSVPANKLPYNGGSELIDIPMWPASTTAINIYAYKDYPFSKLSWKVNKIDADEGHIKFFAKKLLDLGEMDTRKEMEEKEKLEKEKKEKDKIAKEKSEKEKLEKEKLEKEKQQKELQAKLEKEKLEKEQQEKLEKERQEKPEKEKEEKENEQGVTANNETSLETEQMKLKKEKEQQEVQKKSNQKVKTEYESEMLKIVAENEKKEKEKQYLQQKDATEGSSLAERMKREQELKARLDTLKIQIALLQNAQQANLYNGQKQQQLKNLIETTATIEKELKLSQSKGTSSPDQFKVAAQPKIEVKTAEYTFSWETVTTITAGSLKVEYKKVEYVWGSVYYYKNGIEIDESVYAKEIYTYKAGK